MDAQTAHNLDICRRQIWMAPLREIVPNNGYSRVVLHCPSCGAYLTSYKTGASWCENGLALAELRNCKCGQKIDYRGVPIKT